MTWPISQEQGLGARDHSQSVRTARLDRQGVRLRAEEERSDAQHDSGFDLLQTRGDDAMCSRDFRADVDSNRPDRDRNRQDEQGPNHLDTI